MQRFSQTLILAIIISSLFGCSMPTMPVYGNWCGPNHPKDIDNATAPIDLIDQACKNHDLCYQWQTYLDADCDKMLVFALDNTYEPGFYKELIRSQIRNYFSISPATGLKDGHTEFILTRGMIYLLFPSSIVSDISYFPAVLSFNVQHYMHAKEINEHKLSITDCAIMCELNSDNGTTKIGCDDECAGASITSAIGNR
jgi:hypothetical protein